MRTPASLFLVLALFTGLSSTASAQGPTEWLSLIQSLQGKGVNQIGDFNLETFRRRAERVPFYSIDEAPPSVMAGSRGSAFYTTSKPPRIYILSKLPEGDLGQLAQLEIHELLGALGYGDADTSKSTALAIIDRAADPGERGRLVQEYGQTIFGNRKKPSLNLAAGGFSVGGGGDLSLVHLKNDVYEQVRQGAGGGFSSSEFARMYPRVNFEPLRRGSRLSLNYIYRFPSTEMLSVYVPTSRLADGSQRAAVISEIAMKLASIFPARNDEPLYPVSPAKCRGQTARMPRPADEDVARIQELRAAFLLQCRYVPEENGATGTTGVTSDFASPDRAGIYKIGCQVDATGIAPYRLDFGTPMGGNATLAKSGTLFNEEDGVTFTLVTDAKGGIRGTGIYYEAGRGAKPVQTVQRGSSVSISVAGKSIRLSCAQEP